ncbi:MAG: hypothetical protein R3F41_07870 [Gammaproteobacteria bacterium]|nr:hypothetical protein [Pseudomonadales bacterium]
MARILCVWEMGSNLGHLANLKLFIDHAVAKGHTVSLAVRELQNVATVLDPTSIQLFQAPLIRHSRIPSQSPTISFTQLIQRQVFADHHELTGLYLAWQSIFDTVAPDLVIYEHAPSALVASLHREWQKWAVGSGFMVPRTDGIFLGVFPRVAKTEQHYRRLLESEKSLLACINRLQQDLGRTPIKSVKEIYQQCDQQLLLTLPELDHFGIRTDGQYLGIEFSNQGLEPVWPDGSGPKVFAYLGYFPKLPDILNMLIKRHARVLLYARSLPSELIARFQDKVCFVDKPVNLSIAFQQADYVINHGNHSTAAQSLVAGIPQLLIWTHQEQLFASLRIVKLQRGVLASRHQSEYESSWEKLTELKRTPAQFDINQRSTNEHVMKRIKDAFRQAGF